MKEIEIKYYIRKRYGETVKSGKPNFGSYCESTTEETALRMDCTEENLASVQKSSNMGSGSGNPIDLAFQKLPIYALRLFHA